MNIDLVLNDVVKIRKKYEEIYSKTGSYFNIFTIAGIESDEVKICRVLTELLNPKGSHCQKDKYLKLFIKNVLNIDIEESEYENIQIYNEYLIDGNRRIDIVIKSENYFIPIEVKIYAEDQDKQCFDYYTYGIRQTKNKNQVIYLTLDGHIPSERSAEGLTQIKEKDDIIGYKEVKTISFREDIIKWLEECISDVDTLKIAPVREVLIQFMSVVRKLANLMEDGEKMEILEEIMSSKDTMKAACGIANSINDAKSGMMEKIFKDIEKRMDEKCSKYPIKRITDINYYNYEDKVKEYYNKKTKYSYPGLNYLCSKVKLKDDIELWFRIEIEDILFCGFCLFDTKNNKKLDKWSDEKYEEIKLSVPNMQRNQDGWWICWYRIPDDDNTPNFEREEDNLFSLFDKEYYHKFIDRCMEEIDYVLKIL